MTAAAAPKVRWEEFFPEEFLAARERCPVPVFPGWAALGE